MWFNIKKCDKDVSIDAKYTYSTRKTVKTGTWAEISTDIKNTLDGKFERKQKWLERQAKKEQNV